MASFFVSRVDTKVDPRLAELARGSDGPQAELASRLPGKAAVANARMAYADFKQIFASERFGLLKARGARVQRPLWASTGTKNPAYSDVMYVDELVGPDTVNTVPPQTLAAYLDHGRVRPSLEEDPAGATAVLDGLDSLGISMSQVTAELEDEGVKAFADAFTALLDSVGKTVERHVSASSVGA